MRAVLRISPNDYELSRVQDLLGDAVDLLGGKEIIDGRQIDDVALATGTANTVTHGLGRNLRGYIVTRRNADCRVWNDTSTSPSKTLLLRTSATVTVSLWVY